MAALLTALTGSEAKLSTFLTWRFWQAPESRVDPVDVWAAYESGAYGDVS